MNINKSYYILISLLLSNICLAEETIGVEEKVKKAYELYLQDQSVTLGSREWRLGADISYTSDERMVLFNHQENRSVQVGLSGNYGITDSIEVFGRVPFLYSNATTKDAFGLTDEKVSSTDLGNATIGASATLFSSADGPTLTFQTAFALPTHTGESPNNKSVITAGLNLYQDFDPVFLYGGLSGSKTLGGNEFDGFNYQAGFGFSLNHRIALGAEISGGYRYAEQFLSSQESSRLTGNATFVLDKKNLIQPSVSFGLNESTPDFTLGLQWTRRF